ncbi:DUF1318 domain-containing protein [Candidatus Sumerlaeota bacterium]|nr:DUF1318 domain-containing protein [Candidatus Sumerlaeota bacterium]
MKPTSKVLLIHLLAASMALALIACLYTKHDIHVTLDIRHIQDTATSIEDVVSGEKQLDDIEKRKGSSLDVALRYRLAALFDPATTCRADDDDKFVRIPNLTPALKTAIENRRNRYEKIRGYKSVGAIGENNRALVEVRSSPILKNEEEKKNIENLVKDENADRTTIYREIATQNKATGSEEMAKIRQTWARVHREKSEKGDWVQAPSDEAAHAAFMESAFAKNLDTKPKPGEWVQAP